MFKYVMGDATAWNDIWIIPNRPISLEYSMHTYLVYIMFQITWQLS